MKMCTSVSDTMVLLVIWELKESICRYKPLQQILSRLTLLFTITTLIPHYVTQDRYDRVWILLQISSPALQVQYTIPFSKNLCRFRFKNRYSLKRRSVPYHTFPCPSQFGQGEYLEHLPKHISMSLMNIGKIEIMVMKGRVAFLSCSQQLHYALTLPVWVTFFLSFSSHF